MNETDDGRPGRPASMHDVARRAGVSHQTVSNVLNNSGGYGEQTRRRVMAAVSALGYQPNRAARSLRSRRTMQLAYQMADANLDVRNLFMTGFLQSLVRAAAERGYQIVVFVSTGKDPLDPYRKLLAARSVDGFILSDTTADDPRIRLLAGADAPFAAFGRTGSGLPQNWVDVDNVAACAGMVDHLVARGHRDIAFLGSDDDHHWNTDRLAGYRLGMRRNGIGPDPELILAASPDNAPQAVRTALARHPRPTAVMAGSDILAAAAVNAARSLGLRPGSDVTVTGFNGGLLEQAFDPPLTTVRIPIEQIAEHLVHRCLAAVSGTAPPARGLIVPTELVPRRSA